MKFSSLFMLALLVVLFSSCTDHVPGDPSARYRVKSLSRILPDNNGISNIGALQCDSENRLISILTYQAPDSTANLIGRTSYEYDNQNRLSLVKRSVQPFGSEEYRYTYNSAGQLGTLDYNAGNGEIYQVTYRYNGTKLESSLRKFEYFFALRFALEVNYVFSGQNLSKINSVQTVEKVIPFVSLDSAIFTYDNKINPFYGVYLIPAPILPAKPTFAQFYYYTYFGGYDNLLTLSKANMLSEVKGSGEETHYQYQYNVVGYPTSRITHKKPDGQSNRAIVETLLYEYEKY